MGKFRKEFITIGHIISAYNQNYVTQGRVAAQRQYKPSFNNLHAHFHDVPILDANLHIQTYIDRRLAGEIGTKPAQKGTILKELKILQAAINFCKNRNLLPMLPQEKDFRLKHTLKTPPARPDFLNREQTYRLLDAALYGKDLYKLQDIEYVRVLPDVIPRIYIFIMLALDTAGRYFCVKTLKWEQINLDKRLISLNPSGRNITSKRRPVVAMSERVFQLLTELRKRRPNDVYVLTNTCSVRKKFKEAVILAGIDPTKCSPHTLRHTFATIALQRGISPFIVAQVMGDNVVTVLKVYGHHAPNFTKEAVNAIA